MYIDNSLVLSSAQSSTVSAASTNYIDTLAAGDAYDNVWFVALITTVISGGTSIAFDLRTDSSSAFGSEVVLFSTGAIVVATLKAGYFAARVKCPLGKKRYLRGYATIVGPINSGAWSMFLTPDVDVLNP